MDIDQYNSSATTCDER